MLDAGFRPYRVRARNIAADSDNKIHDDTVARRYGFSGGLVPGVVVHAYLAHPPAERWGSDWVATGSLRSRFSRPVYDGDDVLISPEPAEAEGSLSVRTPANEVAASAVAGGPDPGGAAAAAAAIDPARWPHLPLPAPSERPPASEQAFVERPALGALDVRFDGALGCLYADAIGEPLGMYREGIAHPGWLIGRANHVLAANVRLGPWIHVESHVRHLRLVRDGDLVSTRAAVLSTFERRGHRFVELDVVIVDEREQPVLRARHLAIYEPRPAR